MDASSPFVCVCCVDRAIVAHAIRVLERSRGWDFKDKLKVGAGEAAEVKKQPELSRSLCMFCLSWHGLPQAVSTLIEVYNHLPPSATYERKLDEAFPVLRYVVFQGTGFSLAGPS